MGGEEINQENIHLDDFLTLLKEYLNSELKRDELKIKLSEKDIKLLKSLSEKFPELFTTILKDLEKIMKDDILDLTDIPNLVILIKDIYNIYSTKINTIEKTTLNDSISIIKTIILLLLELEYIKVVDKEKFIKLLDASIELLSSTVIINNSLCNFFKCFA